MKEEKYKKLLEQTHNGRIYDNLRYYGAATGRWAGLSFQMHNLPRAKVDDPQAVIKQFFDTTILKNDPIQAAKALIRPMIKAPPGKLICAVDYHAIENVYLLWIAGEVGKLEFIRKGFEHYRVFAASAYQTEYEDVTDEQRFLGKVAVLGAGYNAAAGAFLNFAQGYGLNLTFEQADSIIQMYRKEHPYVRQFWYSVRDRAIAAVHHKGREFEYNRCKFKVVQDRNFNSWLRIKLPSGRSLVYNSPEVRDDKYGPVVTHMGINSYTKQWARLKLIPGRITENIVQAISRDMLVYGKQRLMDFGFKVIGSVHDEIILEVEEEGVRRYTPDKFLNEIIEIATTVPPWCHDLPLTASGFIDKRYRKD